jgi:hypothetical protein
VRVLEDNRYGPVSLLNESEALCLATSTLVFAFFKRTVTGRSLAKSSNPTNDIDRSGLIEDSLRLVDDKVRFAVLTILEGE